MILHKMVSFTGYFFCSLKKKEKLDRVFYRIVCQGGGGELDWGRQLRAGHSIYVYIDV